MPGDIYSLRNAANTCTHAEGIWELSRLSGGEGRWELVPKTGGLGKDPPK